VSFRIVTWTEWGQTGLPYVVHLETITISGEHSWIPGRFPCYEPYQKWKHFPRLFSGGLIKIPYHGMVVSEADGSKLIHWNLRTTFLILQVKPSKLKRDAEYRNFRKGFDKVNRYIVYPAFEVEKYRFRNLNPRAYLWAISSNQGKTWLPRCAIINTHTRVSREFRKRVPGPVFLP